MKRYRGKKRLATMEKQAWQKKFLKAQEALLSDYAYKAYKELGPGMVYIELNHCMPLIMPGMNIPKLNYYCELTLEPNHPDNKYWLERTKQYDPEKQYIVVFKTYQAEPPFALTWIRDLKLLSEEEFEKEYDFACATVEIASGNMVLKPLFDDPTKH